MRLRDRKRIFTQKMIYDKKEKFLIEAERKTLQRKIPTVPTNLPKYPKHIDFEDIVLRYSNERLGIKKLHELISMTLLLDPRKSILGLFALHKRLIVDLRLSTRLRIFEAGILPKLSQLLKAFPNFALTGLKFITSFLYEPNSALKDEIEIHFWDFIVLEMKSKDSQKVCYAVNLLNKLVRADITIRRSRSDEEICKLISLILNINEQIARRPEHIIAVKYRTYNELLGSLDHALWPSHLWEWIVFTMKIMHIGAIRDYRSLEFEDWARAQQELQEKLLQDPAKIDYLYRCGGKGGTVFFYLHIFKFYKKEIINLGLREVLHREVVNIHQTGL